jgi:hypothetical protein
MCRGKQNHKKFRATAIRRDWSSFSGRTTFSSLVLAEVAALFRQATEFGEQPLDPLPKRI